MKTIIALLLLLISTTAHSQQCLSRDELRTKIESLVLQANSVDKKVNNTPLNSPTAKSSSEPTSSGNPSGIIDGAQIPTFLAAALNTGLDDTEDGSLSLSFNAIMIKALFDPDVISKQSVYEQDNNEKWRRFATTIAFGGTGLALDSDGDGMPDEANVASDITDQINFELSYRLAGKSRDRREKHNFALISDAVRDDLRNIAEIENNIDSYFFDAVGTQQCPQKYLASEVANVLASKEFLTEVKQLSTAGAAFGKNYDKAIEEIDGKTLWTLVLGNVQRDSMLGPDSWHIGLRGAYTAPSNKQFSLSADYKEYDDHPMFLGDLKSIKVAGEMKWFIRNNDPFSIALSYEAFDGSDLREDDELFKIGATYSLRLKQGVTVPISLTYANRNALLEEEDEVIGRIGISFDTDNLLEKLLGSDLFTDN